MAASVARLPQFNAAGELQRWTRLSAWVAAVCLGMVLGWGLIAPLNSAVVARGLIRVEGGARQLVQHREGGLVKRILVRNGAVVKAGQPLIELEDAEVTATSDLIDRQAFAELARQARLTHEVAFAREIQWPEVLVQQGSEPGFSDLLRAEKVLFTQRRQTLDLQIDIIARQLVEVDREVAETRQQVAADLAAARAMEEQLRVNAPLVEQGFVSTSRFLDLKRTLADYQSRVSENRAALARAQQKRSELQLRTQTLRNAYREQAVEDQKQSSLRLAELQQRSRPARDALRRQVVVAPVAGTVMNLKVHTLGGSITPRETLLEIVPARTPLVAELRLPPEAIAEVHTGMEAEVRLLAFQMRSTPMVTGKLSYISADALTDATGMPYYAAELTLDPVSLAEARVGDIQPGMPLEAFLRTRERNAIGYLFDPIRLSMSRAFKER